MHGKGTFTDEFGSSYEGDWDRNLKGSQDRDNLGKGISIEFNSDKEPCDQNNGKYDGEWYKDHKHNKGVFVYEDNTVYDGQWRIGKKHGYGTLTLPGKDSYEGEWSNNYPCGTGKYTYTNE